MANRLLTLSPRKQQAGKPGAPSSTRNQTAKPGTGRPYQVRSTPDAGKPAPIASPEVFIAAVLKYFFAADLSEDSVTIPLKEFAARLLWAVIRKSTCKHVFPTPPSRPAPVEWLVSPAVQQAYHKCIQNKKFEPLLPAVRRDYGASFEEARKQSVKVLAQSMMAQEMSTGNRALVIFLENTGALPFQWDGVPDAVRVALEQAVDYLSEEFVKWLNKFKATEGGQYKKVIILEDAKATFSQLKDTLHSLAKEGCTIDLFTLTHGGRNSFSGYKSVSVSASDVRSLRDSYGSPLPLRAVYMMNCYGSTLNDDWIYAGAVAVAGSKELNVIPEPMLSKFWGHWKGGKQFNAAVDSAYDESVNMIRDAVRITSKIPVVGDTVFNTLWGKIKPYIDQSAPVIEGPVISTAINSVLSTISKAKSVDYDDVSGALFDTGEHVLTGEGNSPYLDRTKVYQVQGVSFAYGDLIAMADLYDTDSQMRSASTQELQRLKALIDRSRLHYLKKLLGQGSGARDVSNQEWDQSTGGRYLKLAEENFGHFSPSNKDILPALGAKFSNNFREFQKYHKKAIETARRGKNSNDLVDALITNAFGDHFLTDAFSAGHLFNKEDLMHYFSSRTMSGGKVNESGKKMFQAIAKLAWRGDLAKNVSKYESAESVGWWIFSFDPNLDSAGRFALVLQGIMENEPDILGKTVVAKIIHDALNQGGVEVTDNIGSKPWTLKGDGYLDKMNLIKIQGAVARSVNNVVDAVNSGTSTDDFVRKAWDHTPRPTDKGKQTIKDQIAIYTDPANPKMHKGIADLVYAYHMDIINELVRRKKIKPKGWF